MASFFAAINQDDSDRPNKWSPLLARILGHAEQTPDAIAVSDKGRSYSYGELIARVDELADRLAFRLTSPGKIVAVCLDRNADLPAWLLAIFKLGAAYVPIDPVLPAARIAQVIDGAQPEIIVANRSLAGCLPDTNVEILDADDADADDDSARPSPNPPAPFTAAPDDLAYVMYTSGSTGQPKGVEVMHGGIIAMLDAFARSPGLQRGETQIAPTRLSFDISILDLFLPLIVGARTVIIDLDEVADPRQLSALIAQHAPNMMQATPATWRALLEWGWTGLPGMRLLCGGEAMTRDLADRLLPRCGELWNVYGPTETTVWSTAHRVTAGAGGISIGRPIDGTKIRIADDSFNEVPHGEVGEIVISGPGVARGYRGAPVLTADRFVMLEDGSRAYRTGDLGRLGSDGLLYCLGRRDDQVKVRGFRMELGDIESALSAHPQVAWCAARVWPDATGENTLVGYIVSRRGGALPVNDVRDFLGSRLPPYMIPDRIIAMVEMPMTPNGKVDRNALPNPVARPTSVPVSEPPAREPLNDVERKLAELWTEILGITDIVRDDDFFERGGYSLITVRLIRRIEEEFGRFLEIGDLIKCSSLAAMGALIAEDRLAASSPIILLNGQPNKDGNRPPLYWLDAGPLMHNMARGVAPDQPVYGLNLMREDEVALNSKVIDIPATAATMCRHLLKAQPSGPYYIGGWCRWGIVAQELACQLRDQGHEVALLVMLDSVVLDRLHPRDAARAGMVRLRRIFTQSPESEEPQSFSERVKSSTELRTPRKFDGDAVLIRAASGCVVSSDVGGWGRKIGGSLTEVRTPGDHESMVRPPHAAQLAANLDAQLLIAQRKRPETWLARCVLRSADDSSVTSIHDRGWRRIAPGKQRRR